MPKTTALLLLSLLFITMCCSGSCAIRVMQMAAGERHTIAVRSDGTVWCGGNNSHGQLGDGTTVNSPQPVKVLGLTGVIAVAAGADFSIAIRNDRTVWTWGDNTYGQLGDGTLTYRTSPVRVMGLTDIAVVAAGPYNAVALRNDGTVWSWEATHAGNWAMEASQTAVFPWQRWALPMSWR